MKIQDANDMSTVTKHQLKDGTIRYRTQVRVQREGYPDSKWCQKLQQKITSKRIR